MYRIGQGLFGKIRFADGKYPEYNRTYLIVSVLDNLIGVLNVSSAINKASKLLYPSNKYINKHYPPFAKKSFVKLDSYVCVSIDELKDITILSNGELLNQIELNNIIKQLTTNYI